ncbi:MAG: OmpA family protein [Polyangia bacterium]|jgi:outer membrane protein OmpA-like peptidoglycan-associated protein|nr:OmpA family protein [Polyangia bacterium]
MRNTILFVLACALLASGCKVAVSLGRAEFEPLAITASPPAPPARPEPPPPRKVEKIEISDKIQFDTGKAIILPKSYSVLDGVVKVMKERPTIKVQVEGHTDSVGDAEKNRALSQQRAESVVKYLVGKGIEASRLSAKGFGADTSIASNDTPEGRETNRRVEFTVVASDQGK